MCSVPDCFCLFLVVSRPSLLSGAVFTASLRLSDSMDTNSQIHGQDSAFSKTQLDRGKQWPSVPWILGSFATNSLNGHPMIAAYDPSPQFMSLSSHVRSTVFQWICSIPASENLFHGSGLCFWTIYGDTIIILSRWDVLL